MSKRPVIHFTWESGWPGYFKHWLEKLDEKIKILLADVLWQEICMMAYERRPNLDGIYLAKHWTTFNPPPPFQFSLCKDELQVHYSYSLPVCDLNSNVRTHIPKLQTQDNYLNLFELEWDEAEKSDEAAVLMMYGSLSWCCNFIQFHPFSLRGSVLYEFVPNNTSQESESKFEFCLSDS